MEATVATQDAHALLQAVLRRDEAAVRAALAAGAPLMLHGVTALHAAALADWGSGVPLLLAAGADLDARADLGNSDDAEAAALELLGLTESQAAALGHWYGRGTALEVAVASGAAGAAAALLSAGASLAPRAGDSTFFQPPTVFRKLIDLAESTAVQSGATAAAAVPAAVQRMAELLLAQGLPPGGPAIGAHKAAVQLTHPDPPTSDVDEPQPPPCDWMLHHLLQMHTSGQLGRDYAPAVAAALQALLDHAAEEPGLEAAAAQWLSVPAAADIEAHRLKFLGCRLLQQGVAGEALSALLALPAVREALQAAAGTPLRDWMNARHLKSLVASAAAGGRPEALDAVLAAGGTITLNDVNWFAGMGERQSPQGLALLLSRGVPLVPADVPPGQVVWWSACPVYALLQGFCDQLDLVLERESMKLDAGPNTPLPSDDGLQQLHADALAMMDELAQAGYRPVTFRNYREHYAPDARVLPTFYPPTDAPRDAAKWDLAATSKWLWRAAQREPWSRATHAHFPPAFRAAARTLLLVAHRGSSPADVQPRRAGLRSRRSAQSTAAQQPPSTAAVAVASLPPELLQRVLRLAAYPLSSWKPRVEEGRMLRDIRQLREDIMMMDALFCG